MVTWPTRGRWLRLFVAGGALAIGVIAIRCGESSMSELEPQHPCGMPCNDGNPCTRDDCNRETGECNFTEEVDGTMCEAPAVPDGICRQATCEPFTGVFTCNEQGVVSAITRGGGPYTFECDGSRSIVTSDELILEKDVILDGEGKMTLDGGDAHRVLRVTEGVSATLRGFAITGGRAGGMTDEAGGGIVNLGGTLRLIDSTVYGNWAAWGGGLASLPLSVTTLTNCTIAENLAERLGGAIYNGSSETTLRSTTISGNFAVDGGGALYTFAPVTIANTLIDGSCDGGIGNGEDRQSPTRSLGHNLESPGDTCDLTTIDQFGVSKEALDLGNLGDHGGGMPTCGLGSGSLAIDQVPKDDCLDADGNSLETDQRGVERPFGDACDIGAIEWMDCEDQNECTQPIVEGGVCSQLPIDDQRPCGEGAGVCREGSCVTREPPITISGPSPFSGCACDPEKWHYQCGFSDTEFQPFVMANPTNPDNIVVVWTQDFNPQRGLVAAVTLDAGRDWQSVVVPSVSECSGSTEFRTVWHPWLAFAPDGQLFLAYDSFGRLSEDVVYHAHVIRSRDGGLSWGPPIRVAPADAIAPSIASDRHEACTLHLAWNQVVNDVPAVLSASTFDCGATWSGPSLIHADPGTSRLRVQVLALPDGTPVALFKQRLPGGLYVKRSSDGGASWPEQPIRISDAVVGPTHAVTPGEATMILAASDRPMAAVDDESGRLAVVWQQGIEQAPPMQVYFSLSEDGGRTWSTPERIDQTAPNPNRSFVIEQAFRPSVAFASDGTIGVTYYNFQNDTPNDDRADADVWFIHCHPARDDCTSQRGWSPPVRLTSRSFDYHRAFYSEVSIGHGEGYWLGDYTGLTTAGTDFLAAFTVTTETDTGDIVFARIPLH